MTEIESALGKSSFGAGNTDAKTRKVLTIEDESGWDNEGATPQAPSHGQQQQSSLGYHKLTPEEASLLKERRAAIKEKQSKVTIDARARIEFLTGIGRIRDSITIENVKFSFQSLKAREQEEVFDALKGLETMTPLKLQFEVRAHTLARSLTHINDNAIDLVVGTDDPYTIMELVIKELDENLADHLYKWYQENIVKIGQDKYSVNTTDDVQEIVEEIKK